MNLQLTINEREARAANSAAARFLIDWQKLPACLVQQAAELLKISSYTYEGAIVFASYNANNDEGKKFHKWATNWLDRQPGIQVQCSERQPKAPPRCPTCHRSIEKCPFPECGVKIAGTVEKGVDTAIVTDMIRLAWEKAYDVAILASSDRDLVPAVEFLELKGLKVIQAGFPPLGSHLARACWGSLDLFACREHFRRSATPRS